MKKLSLVIIWHMHQPNYKSESTGYYLMPWTRLHAIKDYLDMLLILDKFPDIRQTFNLVPLLIDQLEDYAYNNAHDIHSALSEKDVKDLTYDDKHFILNSFFDANYLKMIAVYEPYDKLYRKRFSSEGFDIANFSDKEYSDIMAWFNIAWFDDSWFESIPELKALKEKGEGYTTEDRRRLIQIQRDIISQIIPAYRERFLSGKIEISTSPYYHPIVPLMINSESAKEAIPDIILPDNRMNYLNDADVQIKKSIEKFKKIFGKRPVGIWPPEQCVSNDTLKLFEKNGFKWTVADEGVLAKSLSTEIVRDFNGSIQNPYDLCNAYHYRSSNDKNIKILFRNALPANLVGFQYGNFDPVVAANDLYDRMKMLQEKLMSSPDKNHVIVTAMDGENCWENYDEDGRPFLMELYRLVSEDPTIECITASEYIKKIEITKVLDNIYSGSWINRNFQLWIGDPIKNMAYDYLHKTRKDLIKISSEKDLPQETLDKAWNEIYMSQSSDWFWWYGEPNDSGQDDLFDLLFREHLQNVYRLIGEKVPEYLNSPLGVYSARQSKGLICPIVHGKISNAQWQNTKVIEAFQGPVYNQDKFVEKVFFGHDDKNLYLKFELNKLKLQNRVDTSDQIFVYLQLLNDVANKSFSHVGVRSKTNSLSPLLKHAYSYELEIMFRNEKLFPLILSRSVENSLWTTGFHHNIKFVYDEMLEIAIPFDDIKTAPQGSVNIVVMTAKEGTIEEIIPVDKPITIIRP